MYKKPDIEEIISAVQHFIKNELLPLTKEDKDLSYKTIIAWNLLSIVLREFELEPQNLMEEYRSLIEILNRKDSAPESPPTKNLVDKLNQNLREKIREEKIDISDPTVWNHVKERIKAELSISNPKYNI